MSAGVAHQQPNPARVVPQSYEELGGLLRQAREDRAFELRAVAEQLYIRTRYLEALETGQLDFLPGGDAFVTGYLARYAAFLGLNPDATVVAYRAIGALPQRRLFHIPERMRSADHPAGMLVMISLAAALLLSFVWAWGREAALPPPGPAIAAPPYAVEPLARIYSPSCLTPRQQGWPPCYYAQRPLLLRAHAAWPPRNVMDLQ